MTQTTVALEACPSCGATGSPFLVKAATGTASAAAGATNAPDPAPAAPATPPAAENPPAAAQTAAPAPVAAAPAASGPDWGQIAQLLLAVLQGAGTALTGVLTGGAATSLVFGNALLRIVQAAVAAYEAHKGKPINPAELTTEDPVT